MVYFLSIMLLLWYYMEKNCLILVRNITDLLYKLSCVNREMGRQREMSEMNLGVRYRA